MKEQRDAQVAWSRLRRNVRFHEVKSTGFDAILQTCTLSMGRNIQNIKQNVQQIYILLCGFQSTNSDRFSGDGYEDPPVPISNTVVKLINAESTWLETAWEDRKPLIDVKAHLRVCLFLCMASYPPRVPGEQGSRRWRSEATTDSLHRLVRSVRWTCSAAT